MTEQQDGEGAIRVWSITAGGVTETVEAVSDEVAVHQWVVTRQPPDPVVLTVTADGVEPEVWQVCRQPNGVFEYGRLPDAG